MAKRFRKKVARVDYSSNKKESPFCSVNSDFAQIGIAIHTFLKLVEDLDPPSQWAMSLTHVLESVKLK